MPPTMFAAISASSTLTIGNVTLTVCREVNRSGGAALEHAVGDDDEPVADSRWSSFLRAARLTRQVLVISRAGCCLARRRPARCRR
jgi:hypothetical protein